MVRTPEAESNATGFALAFLGALAGGSCTAGSAARSCSAGGSPASTRGSLASSSLIRSSAPAFLAADCLAIMFPHKGFKFLKLIVWYVTLIDRGPYLDGGDRSIKPIGN